MKQQSLKTAHNKYKGERIFLLGNGPSLNKTPLEKLENEFTFGVNSIYKIFSETEWKPDFYFNIFEPKYFNEIHNLEEFKNEVLEKDIICFLNKNLNSFFDHRDNIFYINRFTLNSKNPFDDFSVFDVKNVSLDRLQNYWSEDITQFVFEYHSMYCMYQISCYLGFEEIYLLGCDLGKKYQDPHMILDDGLDPHRFNSGGIREYINDAKNKNVLIESLINAVAYKLISKLTVVNGILGKLINNSSSDYFISDYLPNKPLKIYDGPKMEKMYVKSHIAAKRICSYNNIDVYNATVGGELEVFDRKDITEILD